MPVTISITSVTNPIGTTNQTAVVVAGTVDDATDTVSVTIVDSAHTVVGPIVLPALTDVTWASPNIDVTALVDGTLVVQATATAIDLTKAFDSAATNKQTLVKDYCTVADLRTYMRDSSSLDTTSMQSAISAASRAVEGICGRHFYQMEDTQYFSPHEDDPWLLDLDDMDLATTAGLTVSVQWSNRANYNEMWVLNTDFVAEPVNRSQAGIDNWPYTYLRAIEGKIWPPQIADYYKDTVKVVGLWGWPLVPAPVKQATLIAAAELYKLGDAPFGVAGFGEYGAIRVKDNPKVTSLLTPYRKGTTTLLMA
jgi:hypothetical protein